MTNQIRKRLIIIGILAGVLLITFVAYTQRSNDFKAAPVSARQISNQNVLRDWLSSEVYNTVLSRINTYVSSNGVPVQSMYISSDDMNFTDDGTFEFVLNVLPGNKSYTVYTKTVSYGGVLSTSVSINGQPQTASVKTETEQTNYTGFDDFTSAGLSVDQTSEIQKQLTKFKKAPKSIAVTNVTPGDIDDEGNLTISFTVSYGSDSYKGRASTEGITGVQVKLFDSDSNDQVFDSGVIDNADGDV